MWTVSDCQHGRRIEMAAIAVPEVLRLARVVFFGDVGQQSITLAGGKRTGIGHTIKGFRFSASSRLKFLRVLFFYVRILESS